MENPAKCAFSDMRDYFNENNIKTQEHVKGIGGTVIDVWIPTREHIYTKEQNRLNKELGITGINKLNNKNGKTSKK